MTRISSRLVVGDVSIGHHHQQQQFDHGFVLTIGGGVYRDVAVHVAQLVGHRGRNLTSDRRDVATEEVELVQQHVLGDDLLRSHVGDADERQHLVRLACGQQGRRQLQRVRSDDVVVGQTMDQQQRACQRRRERQQRRVGVRSVVNRRVAEVALGVVRVRTASNR